MSLGQLLNMTYKIDVPEQPPLHAFDGCGHKWGPIQYAAVRGNESVSNTFRGHRVHFLQCSAKTTGRTLH